MTLSARILGFFLAFFLIIFISKVSFAQTTNYIPQNTQTQNLSQGVPNNLNTYSQSVLFSVMSAVGCQLAGIDPANPNQPCLGADPKTGKIGFIQNKGGLVGFMGSMIMALYTPPAHTSDYIRYLSGNFGIAKSANAQNYTGVGLTTIAPIANVWIIFRNLVYLFFVVIFIFIGLGIMLRVKIDPRTVMTIQNQIPKIIIGIILVTLSFPIAGFLIDIMWVVILVIISILKPLITTPANSYNFITPFGLVGTVAGIPGGVLSVAGGVAGFLGSSISSSGFDSAHVSSLVNPALPTPITLCSAYDFPCLLNLGGAALSAVLGAVIGFLVGVAVSLIAFFVVIIALLWAMFKLWFELLKAYVSILIGIVFAPFWIIAGLIPGSGEKVGFGAWLREMLGNLMAFPAAIGMFFLAAIFAQQFNANYAAAGTGTKVFFIPPLIGSQSDGFGVIIAFGILMMTPNVVKMTKAAFKSKGIEGGAIGQGVAAGQAIVGGAIGGGLSRTFRTHVNPNTGEKMAVGSGARFIERRVKLPIARKILGLNAEQQADRVNNTGTPTGIRPKNIRNRQGGGSTPPPAPPTQNTP